MKDYGKFGEGSIGRANIQLNGIQGLQNAKGEESIKKYKETFPNLDRITDIEGPVGQS